MYKIIITDTLPLSVITTLQKKTNYHVKIATDISADKITEIINEFHALIVRSATKVTSQIIDAATNLKVIGRAGTGLDNIDVNYARSKNIEVLNTPGSNAHAVAELTVALIFALTRKLYTAIASLKEHRWEKRELQGAEVKGKTLGLVGFGQIGQKVGKIAAGLGMKILVFKQKPLYRSPAFECELVELDYLLDKADFVSLHLPRNKLTDNMFTLDKFKKMKKSAFLINCARGGIVNEEDLLQALNQNFIAGAALDVFDQEPPVNFHLIKHEKVIATPHIGASTIESQTRVAEDIVQAVMNFLETKYIFISGTQDGE